MSFQTKGPTATAEGKVIEALEMAADAVASLAETPEGPPRLPALRRTYLEIENSVFLLKMAADVEDAPPLDPALEKLGRDELDAKMAKSLQAAKDLALVDPMRALSEARVARDCAAVALHSLNMELRRKR
jgi:hypothetical protein